MPKDKSAKLQKTDDDDRPVKARLAEAIRKNVRIARFKGATIMDIDGRWVDMTSDRFSEMCYKMFGDGINKSRISDLYDLFRTTSPDMSHLAHYIAFGQGVWDSRVLDWTDAIPAEDCVYRVPFSSQPSESRKRIKFIMDLAQGDEGVYDDILQSVAPLIMEKKPTGVIWYLGSGANGKSTLVHLLYIIFGSYLTELTVKQLEDERDTPQLNGKLGNVCKESSEGFVEDTRTYKSIGTHEGFSVHKFHSQDMVEIEGNVHHIFSANNIPTFGDKSYGARRRTLVIPFNARFKPDETFEDRTFTPEFIEAFVAEIIRYARVLKDQNYEYQFSPTTKAMKEKYDTDANTAQTYADELVAENYLGFYNFNMLRMDYETWCAEHGYKESSINVLRKAMDEKGFERKSVRLADGKISKMYAMANVSTNDLEKVGGIRNGLYVLNSDARTEVIPEEDKQQALEDWG